MFRSVKLIGRQLRRIARHLRGAKDFVYLGNGTGITRTHRGHRMFVYTHDLGISPHLIMEGEWEWWIEHAVLKLVSPGDAVIEVGCNMGYHTLALADRIGPAGRLYGFEANPELVSLLRWTLDHNRFASRTTIYNLAVIDKCGEVELAYDRDGVGGGHVVYAPHSKREVIRVAACSLDDILPDISNVALLRMDVEGCEPLVISGARRLIERSPNIAIVAEWAIDMMGARLDLVAFVNELIAAGFQAWRIARNSDFVPVTMDELLRLSHCDIALARSNTKRFS